MSLEGSITSDEEDAYKEESPCGRWHRRNVRLADVPGIDALYQAMDMEEGVEVVWNEITIACVPLEDDNLVKLCEKLIKLTKVEHPNLLKLYGSWYNKEQSKVVFTTEYYSAGSLHTFIQRRFQVNKTRINETLWKRWCRQILSAVSYLHSKEITHGYVTADTVFIQHDGLIKLGSIVPSTIQDHIAACSRTHRQRHRHYCAPEYGMCQVQKMVHRRSSSVDGKKSSNTRKTRSLESMSNLLALVSELDNADVTQATKIQRPHSVDIYAFGILCLEILCDLSEHKITQESPVTTLDDVKQAIASLEPHQQDLINLCMEYDGSKRPDAAYLLKLNILHEIPDLRIMCVNMLLHADDVNYRDVEESAGRQQHFSVDNKPCSAFTPQHLDIEKIEREIKNGFHSIPEVGVIGKISPIRFKTLSPDTKEVSHEDDQEEIESGNRTGTEETRLILCIKCQLNPSAVSGNLHLKLEFQMNDNMVRIMSTDINEQEDPGALVDEIIQYGLLNKLDRDMVLESLEECLST
ncbi:nuclear receptor-binding protein-like isoform X3 [Bolinopsis microptera]|uniref:nuclear receptor-binding protein-like isoform X3 n=1 Tax=Bolinopsis microptera TaxID=2820187 RepID=UPI0030793AEA